MVFIGSKDFSKYFSNSYLIKPNENLPSPVAFHIDMNLCKIDDTVFLYKDCCFADEIIKCGYKIKFISEDLGKKYPFDVPLNCKVCGNTVILNSKTVSRDILDYCKKSGKKIIDVAQGYAACSTLALNENAFITSDKGVYNTLSENGLSPLLIREGYIDIDEYNYGFIGGASGFYDGTLYFFGDISKHPDYDSIKKYLDCNNIQYRYFIGNLTDIGSICDLKKF